MIILPYTNYEAIRIPVTIQAVTEDGSAYSAEQEIELRQYKAGIYSGVDAKRNRPDLYALAVFSPPPWGCSEGCDRR